MIITLVLDVVLMLVRLIVSLIPKISFDLNISEYVAPVAAVFGYVDTFISIPVLLFCMSATLIVDNFSFIVKIVTFVWSKIPFVG